MSITLHSILSDIPPISGNSVPDILSRTRDLSGRTIYGQHLRGVDFSRTNLWRTTFRECNLEDCVFDYAVINRTKFDGCTMDGISMVQWPTCTARCSIIQAGDINVHSTIYH